VVFRLSINFWWYRDARLVVVDVYLGLCCSLNLVNYVCMMFRVFIGFYVFLFSLFLSSERDRDGVHAKRPFLWLCSLFRRGLGICLMLVSDRQRSLQPCFHHRGFTWQHRLHRHRYSYRRLHRYRGGRNVEYPTPGLQSSLDNGSDQSRCSSSANSGNCLHGCLCIFITLVSWVFCQSWSRFGLDFFSLCSSLMFWGPSFS